MQQANINPPFLLSRNRVQPITVGCTLRRLVVKVAGRKVVDEMAVLLAPDSWSIIIMELEMVQRPCCDAKLYLDNLDTGNAVLKLDFQNAFNSICRDEICSRLFEAGSCSDHTL